MYFNRKNAAQKNWRMIKKGKHFLFGCSLVFAVGATLVTPTVKADTVEAKTEASSTTEGNKPVAAEEDVTYAAPAVEVAPAAVAEEKVDKAVETTQNSKEELVVATEKAKEADGVQLPSLTVVADSSALTEEEKANIVEAVKGVNPTATDVQVQADGSVVVTFADGSSANLTAAQTVKVAAPAETSATQPKSRSRRAAGQDRSQDRSMEGKDIKFEYKGGKKIEDGDPTQRAKIEYRQLDDYEVVNGKTVPTDPSGQGRPVLEWTVTFNEAKYDKPGAFWYFSIPKNVSDPYNVVTEYDGDTYATRTEWNNGDGNANAEGKQFIDDGSKLENRVKLTTGAGEYDKVPGLNGVMANSKKLYVLQTNIGSGIRKFTVRYRTVVEDPSQTISYIAGVQAAKNLRMHNWYAISGKYDKELVSAVATPNVTPNLTKTSVNVPVQTVASTSSTLSGTGVPGATIKLYIDGQEQNIGNVTVDSRGNWTTGELPTALNNNQGDGTTIKPRQLVQVSQTVDGNESSRRTVPVSVGVTTVEPSSLTTNQDAVVAGQKEVTLKVPHDAGIAYMRYTNTAGETVEIPVKRDNASSAWTSQKSDKATVKSVENGKFQDTIVLTMADKIAGTEVAAISNVVEGGFSSVADWQPRSVENQAPTIASAVEGNKKTVAQGAQLDLASLVTVADKEDDAQATLGDKVHAEVVSVNGNAATKTVDTNTQGTYTVKYKAVDSQGKESGEIEVTVVVENVAPTKPVINTNLTGKAKTKTPIEVTADPGTTVELFDKDNNKIGEATADNNGKATITPTADIPAGNVTAKATKNGKTSDASNASVATPVVPEKAIAQPTKEGDKSVTVAVPASKPDNIYVTIQGKPTNLRLQPDGTYDFIKNDANATVVNNPDGTITLNLPEGTTLKAGDRIVTRTQNDDPSKREGAVASQEDQTYPQLNQPEKVTVANPSNLTDDEKAAVKAAVKKANPSVVESELEVDGQGNVTYKHKGAGVNVPSEIATLTLTDTVQVATTPTKPVIKTDLTGKAKTKTPIEVTADPGTTVELFDKDNNKIGEATADENGKATITPTADIPAGNVTAKATKNGKTSDASNASVATPVVPEKALAQPTKEGDKSVTVAVPASKPDNIYVTIQGKPTNLRLQPDGTYDFIKNDANATVVNNPDGTITLNLPEGTTLKAGDRIVTRTQNDDPSKREGAVASQEDQTYPQLNQPEKVTVANPSNLTDDEKAAVKAAVKKANPSVVESELEVDGQGNVTYKHKGAGVNVPSEIATLTLTDTVQVATTPTKPVIKTDLTGKAKTKTPIEVTADPGTTVELFDKDNNKIGEATADENGKATITPTADIPAGNVTAKATKNGKTSDASNASVATPVVPEKALAQPTKEGDKSVTVAVPASKPDNIYVTIQGKPTNLRLQPDGTYDFIKNDANATVVNNPDGTITLNLPEGTTLKAGDRIVTRTQNDDPSKREGAVASQEDQTYPQLNQPEKVTVANPSNLTDDEKAAVKAAVKKANPSVVESELEVDGQGNVTYKHKGAGVNVPSEIATLTLTDTVQVATTPTKPVIKTDLTGKAKTKTPIEVTADPGTTVELFDKDNNKIGEATADENGKATITPTADIPAGNVTAKATKNGKTSDASNASVATPVVPEKALAQPTKEGDKSVTVAVPASKPDNIYVTIQGKPTNLRLQPDGTYDFIKNDANATVVNNPDGTITLNLPEGTTLKAGDRIVTRTQNDDPSKREGAVASQEDQTYPQLNQPEKVTVANPSNLTDDEKAAVKAAVKKANPSVVESELEVDGQGNVTYKHKGAGVNVPSEIATLTLTDTVQVATTPTKPVIKTDLTGKAKTKTPIEVTADPGTTVELFDKDNNKIGEATADENGKATITPTADIPAGNVTAKATKNGKTSDASNASVATPVVPEKALAQPTKEGDKSVTVAVPASKPDNIYVTIQGKPTNLRLQPDGTYDFIKNDANATVVNNPDGTITLNLPEGTTLKAGDRIVTRTQNDDPSKREGAVASQEDQTYPQLNQPEKVTVANPSNLTDDEKAAVKAAVKKANPSVVESELEVDGQGNVTYKHKGAGVNVPSEIATLTLTDTVQVATTPTKPVIKTDLTGKAKTKTPIEVTADPGTTVELFDKDNNKIGEATADENGKATITPTADIPAGNVTAKATKNGKTSDASNASVATPVVPEKALAQPTKEGDKSVTVAVPASKPDNIYVTIQGKPTNLRLQPDGTYDFIKNDANATVVNNPDGTITLNLPEGTTLKAGDRIVTRTQNDDPSKREGAVASQEDQTYPQLNQPEKVTVANPSNLTDDEKAAVKAAVKKANPSVVESELEVDGQGNVTYKHKGAGVNVPSEIATLTLTDTVQVATTPTKPVIKTDLTGKAGTKTPVEVTAEPGSTVELFDKDGKKIGEGVADENGKATIEPKEALPEGEVTAKATDKAGNVSDPSEPKVSTDTTAPAKPVVETDLTGKAGTKTPVEVTAEPGSTVELFDKDGKKIGEGVADENGKATIEPKEALPEGEVTAKATDKAGNVSDPSEPKVSTDTTAPAKPVVETDLTGKAGTKTPVEVTAEPGSTVELFDKDGKKIGEGVADENGKATIEPKEALPEGEVTAKATDKAGNVSDPSEPKVSTDTTAPAKPVVETDLTGKAGTKTPVEVTAEPGSTVELFDKDGKKIGEGVADENGKATIEPKEALPEGEVTAKATDKAGNVSDPSEPKVSTDTTAPAKPVVETDLTGKAGTKTPVEVTAEPGSTVELFDKDGKKIGEGVADENGKATIEPKEALPEGEVTAKATDKAGNVSDPSEPKVSTDTTAPAKPVVETDLTGKAGTKTPVEVTAEPGSTVELFDKDGKKIGEGVADENGKATIEPKEALPEGEVTAKATDKAGNVSDPSEPKVSTDTTAPAKPVVETDLTGKAGTKTPVEVTAEPGSTVELFDKDGKKIGEGVADENGKATIEPKEALPEGEVTAKATDKAGNVSDPSEPKVSTDTTAPAKPVVETDLTGKAGTKTPVEVTAEPGSTVELFDKDGKKIGEGVADENGKATIEPKEALPEGEVTAKATDKAGNVSDPSEPKVSTDTTAPAKPVVETDLTGKAGTKTPVEVTAEPGSTVELFDKDGKKIGEGVADENGKATIEPKEALPEGEVTAKATDKAGNVSDPSEPKVSTDTTAPAKPVVETDLTGKAGTKTPVEVTAEPGSTVELFDKDGKKIGEGVADENGKATIEPKEALPEGEVTAKATDKAGNVSDPSEPKVSTDTTAPAKPVVETDLTGKAGTKTPVEVTAEPGSTVELFDKDGKKIGEGVADENGKATIEPKEALPEGEVTAKATDKAGNVSDPSEPKVSTDTTAPAKPVVETDLTGKAGTKTPVEVTAEPGSTVELFDKDGKKIGEGVADENGKATIEPKEALPEGEVTAKATDKAGNVSDPSEPKVSTDTTAPAKPVVETDLTGKAGTKTPVEVTAEPGSTVELFDKDGKKIGEGVADENGKATIEPKEALPEGEVTAKATDKAGNVSDPSEPKVSTDTTAPAKPVVETDLTGKAGTKTPVEVTAEPGSTVELFDKDGKKIGEGVADENGKATIEPKEALPEGEVTAKATDKAGNVSDPSEPKVSTDTTAPAKPVVETDLTGKAGTKTPVEVTAEPGSTVELFDKDGKKIGEGVADENGKATIEPKEALPEGEVTAKATDKAGNVSDPSEPKVSTDTTAPAKPVVETDLTGKAGTKTPVEVTAEPGSTVELFDKDGKKIGEGVADENGKATIEPKEALPEGEVTAKATDKAGNVSDPSEPKVSTDTTAPAKPVVETDLTGKAGTKTPVEVTAEPGSTVELFDKDGKKIGEGVADENGKATITPTVDIPAGGVTAIATDPSGNTSDASDEKVATATTPAKDPEAKTPVKDPANLTDAEKAKVAEEVKKANPTAKDVEVGKDGTTTVTFPDGSKAEIPAAKTVEKAKDAEGIKDPEAKTPVKDPANLTDAEKAKVADEVKKANPTAKDVEVGKDGTTTVTFPDGSKAVIPADKTVKKSDDKVVTDPAVTPVTDPSNLTDAEKAKVADEVKKANPTVSKVEVGSDGTATVTYPDGTTAVIPADKTVKKSDDKVVTDPSVTPVTDPSNLTDAEKAKVADEVKKANPTVSKVEVGNDGTTTVTYPDGTTAVIPADKTVKKSDDKAVKDPAVTPVVDPSNLTDAEKAKVADEVKKDNPTAKDVEVGNDGTTTVTYPDGTTAVIPADKTVKKSDDKAVKDPAVTPVVDPSNLTDAEKAKVADEVKKANPTAKDVEVGKDGTTTVTYPDGTTAVIPADKTVKKSDDKAVKDPAVTPVVDPSNLTDAEKAKVADEVKKANPTVTDVKVDKDGITTVTYPDGTTAVIPADKTVKKSADKELKDPSVTPVTDPSNLTDAEKGKVAEEVKKSNPTVTDVKVDKDGTTTVTYPDGTTAVIPADKTVKKSADKELKDPSVTPVVDPSNLTDLEKAKVAEEVKKANPTLTDVTVGNDGTATVTYPDGTTAVIPADKTVKKSADKELKDPTVTPVTDPSNLTDTEKAKVADEVKKSNPTVTDVTVGNDGTATVTYPDGTTAVIPADKTVKKSADKDVKDPAVTPVVDPSNLTDAEKAKVADKVKKANPTASKVEVGNDGTATVTFPDGSVVVLTPAKTVKSADSNGVKNPSVTPVTDPSNLTDAEKAKVADEVKKANPTATDIKVNNDGSVVVTFADGSVAVIASEKAVKEATKESAANQSAKKAGAKELPNTGTEQSNASLGLALLAAATGGLLFAKKRKEEE